MTWLAGTDASSCYISALTLMELEIGILRIKRRDPTQGDLLRRWMESRVMPEFAERTFVDAAVALRRARLHVPHPRAEQNALIAVTTLVHAMTVVTRNVAEFTMTGVPLLNPWAAS